MSGIYCSSSRPGRGYLPQTDRSCRRFGLSFGNACQSPSLYLSALPLSRGLLLLFFFLRLLSGRLVCLPGPLTPPSFSFSSLPSVTPVSHSQLMTDSGLAASRCAPGLPGVSPLRALAQHRLRVGCCCALDWLVCVCGERDSAQLLYIFYIKVNLRERRQNPTWTSHSSAERTQADGAAKSKETKKTTTKK